MHPDRDVPTPDLPDTTIRRRRRGAALSPAHLALAAVAGIGVFLLARLALDVFLLLLLVAVVGVLRRTAGDWLGDLLGVRGGTVAFAAAISAGGWWIVGTDSGRASVGQFFSAAGRLGFDSVLQERVRVPSSTRPLPPRSVPARAIAPSPSTGSSSSPSASPGPAATERAAERGDGPPVIPTRLTVRATIPTPDRVVLQARLSTASTAPSGRVEFSINGRVVASARVDADGNAETTVALARPGSYRVEARYAGNDRFGPATAQTAFTM
jgi:hypothetical protein